MTRIRSAITEDIEAIQGLYCEQFEAMARLHPLFFQQGGQSGAFIGSMIGDEHCDILLLEDEYCVVGFVLVQEKETADFPFFVKHRYAYIMDIVVTGSSRNRGYGQQLMDAAKVWASERSLEYVELDVLANNEGALRFYERNGFDDKRRTMYAKL